MELGLYLTIDIFCGIILCILGYNSKRQLSRIMDDRLFIEVIFATVIMDIADIVWSLVNGVKQPGFRIINVTSSAIYMIMTGVVGFIWAIYVDCKVEYSKTTYKLRAMGYSAFAVILMIMTLSSPWTKAIFYVDEFNIYHRGKFYLFQVMVGYIYLVVSTVISMTEIRNIKILRKRKEISRIPLYALSPIIGGLLQVYFTYIPFVITGITISILLIYVNIQNKQLSRDALTGIYNRWQLNRFLDTLI